MALPSCMKFSLNRNPQSQAVRYSLGLESRPHKPALSGPISWISKFEYGLISFRSKAAMSLGPVRIEGV